MLLTIFISVALVGGGVFGFYASHLYHKRRFARFQEDVIASVPRRVLEKELENRDNPNKSAYR